MYRILLTCWAALVATAALPFWQSIVRARRHGPVVTVLAVVCALFICWFWLNGMKDLVYTVFYHSRRLKLHAPAPVRADRSEPHVVLVYCTCDDFDADSLHESMQQQYSNYRTVILDDSRDAQYIEAIDWFAITHAVEVIRRADRVGFKAGNLNNYLGNTDYDYFVILDSDEVIPPEFITRALDYFAANETAGIVQANHVASRNDNKFMATFAPGVDAHWPAYQTVKSGYGFLSLLGHGAMVSRACYQQAGGFPHVVAEDLCFSIRARSAGFLTVFAPDIVCEEAYPVNYLAFKKRHSKWTQGNMEFIKKFTGEIFRSPLTWFEKLDILLFTYSLPLTSFFFGYLVINVVVLPAMGRSLRYPLWLLVPTLGFLLAPMLNDFLTYWRKWTIRQQLWYSLHTMGLYGSMFYTSLRSSVKSLFGESVFIVTPKEAEEITWRQALRANLSDLTFLAVLLGVCFWLDGNVLPVALIGVTCLSSAYLTTMSNRSTSAAAVIKEPWSPPRPSSPSIHAARPAPPEPHGAEAIGQQRPRGFATPLESLPVFFEAVLT